MHQKEIRNKKTCLTVIFMGFFKQKSLENRMNITVRHCESTLNESLDYINLFLIALVS